MRKCGVTTLPAEHVAGSGLRRSWRPAISASDRTIARKSAEDFIGTDRFLVQRRLGAGAYGVVFEAYDRRDNVLVAVKVLHNADGDALYRFKKGFRSLAGIRHPNLVAFHELFSEQGFWFFTMELVVGVDLIAYLRSDAGASSAGSSSSGVARFSAGSWSGEAAKPLPAVWSPAPAARPSPHLPDPERLPGAFEQLARGLARLHQEGKLHRDIKPSNVLVTAENRVVLLDFGLVAELAGQFESLVVPMLGTPAYMSPEQAQGLPSTTASDVYSVGVMLFEALTGELPWGPAAPGALPQPAAGGVDPDGFRHHLANRLANAPPGLSALCCDLLRDDPRHRPSVAELLQRLGGGAEDLLPATAAAPRQDPLFVGREAALSSLERALHASRQGAVVVYISGASGIGKSALVHHFLDGLAPAGEDAVVLLGKCHIQESVPYKAWDSLIDALTRFLRSLPTHQVEALLPTQIAALVRLFPVLRRVPLLAEVHVEPAPTDPQQGLRRAASALRQLLARIAERRTLILAIDDLQWGDGDSFSLLELLLRPPDAPPLLLLGSFRNEGEAQSSFLRALAEHRVVLKTRGIDVHEIELTEFSPQEAHQLVELWLHREGVQLPPEQIRKVVREAAGSPIFLAELLRDGLRPSEDAGAGDDGDGQALGSGGDQWMTGEFRLSDVILARVAELPSTARDLLALVAVAGKPLEVDVALEALGLKSRTPIFDFLTEAKLVRWLKTEERNEIETYHDRIREAVVSSLDAATLSALNRQLALALESSGRAEPETLAMHFQATAETERARQYLIAAAQRAGEALAFDRAARLYRMALDLVPAVGAEQYELRVKLGDALASAGQSREAAETFLRAASDSGTINPFEAQRSAAENLLISGHVERGLGVLRHVLRSVGLKLEEHPFKVRCMLWVERLRLGLRGLHLESRPESACDPQLLRQIDLCWAATTGLCLIDVRQAALFHARHLRLALQAGEPQRAARGMAMEIFFGMLAGRDPETKLIAARELAGRVEGTYASSLTEMAAGMASCARGAFKDAIRRLTRAEKQLRETGLGVAWELDTVRHFQTLAQIALGHWSEVFAEWPALLQGARQRGDLYLEVHLRFWVISLLHLSRDEPDKALAEIAAGSRQWAQGGFHYQHFGRLVAEVQTALYSDRARAAWKVIQGGWPLLVRSMLLRLELVFIQFYDLRARIALALASDAVTPSAHRPQWLALARRDARRISRKRSSWAAGQAGLIRAGIAIAQGQNNIAKIQLERAEAAFAASQMEIHALFARRRRLALAPDESKAAGAAVDEELRARGILNPERMSALFTPGRRI